MSENGLHKLFRNSFYYFRERISLYSCDVVERRPNLVISTSHGLLNLQATMHRQYPGFEIHMKGKIEKLNTY
jgi:hypothetical protein